MLRFYFLVAVDMRQYFPAIIAEYFGSFIMLTITKKLASCVLGVCDAGLTVMVELLVVHFFLQMFIDKPTQLSETGIVIILL